MWDHRLAERAVHFGKGLVTAHRLLIGSIVLTLAGCSMPADEQADKNRGKSMPLRKTEVKEANVSDLGWRSGNPAEWPGVKVYRPKKLEHTSYDRSSRTIIDLDTGDALKLGKQLGPGDEERSFGFYNQKTGPYEGGFFISWDILSDNLQVWAITSVRTTKNGQREERGREEFDIGRLAEMFRALNAHDTRVLVVDARPEKASEAHPQDESQKDAQ